MAELETLYQEMIIDHGRKPRNFRVCEDANKIEEGFNPLCGDKVILYITEKKGVIEDISFQGSGCAISIASASMMTEVLKGKTIEEAKRIFEQFHGCMTNHMKKENVEALGKLKVLLGVAQSPSRIKCATLAWHTLMKAFRALCPVD